MSRVSETATARPAAPSQSAVVIDGVKSMILSGALRPGDRLPVEKELGELLGVSRGSLREGVRALAILGVLDTRQGDGTYVTDLDAGTLLGPISFLADLQTPEGSVHMLAVRRVLEAESAAMAARNATAEQLAEMGRLLDRVEEAIRRGDAPIEEVIEADSEFHRLVAQASGNPAFLALIDALVGRTTRARLWRAIREHGVVLETVEEHRGILHELQSGEPDRARLRMSMHILGVEEYTTAHLADQ